MEYSLLHNELRLKSPGKPAEFYDDAIRYAIGGICRKTALWQVSTDLVTVAGQSVYSLTLPTDTVIHSSLELTQGTRILTPPTNGVTGSYADSDYIQTFETYSKNEIKVYPIPISNGTEFSVLVAVKPISGATESDNDKFFDEYKETVIYGAMVKCAEFDKNYADVQYNETKFKNGISSIHIDVIKKNANTPLKINTGW